MSNDAMEMKIVEKKAEQHLEVWFVNNVESSKSLKKILRTTRIRL